MKKINILGLLVADCTLPELLKHIIYFIKKKQKRTIMYANIHVANNAFMDESLKKAINSSDITYCDGAGIKLAAAMKGKLIPQRMTGADWIYDLCDLAQKSGYSLFLLGGLEGIAEKTKQKLIKRFPELKITGTHNGYFSSSKEENSSIIDQINRSQPDILLVGLGTPIQEKWINKNRNNLEIPIVWAVGALMDFVSKKTSRAPEFMLKNNMEWLYRLYKEPCRMWKRYLIGNIIFFVRVLLGKK